MAEDRDDDHLFTPRGRDVRDLVREIMQEERHTWWDRVGFDVRSSDGIERLRSTMHALKDAGFDVATPGGVEKLKVVLALSETLGLKLLPGPDLERTKRAVAWLYRSEERSATMVKRMLGWLGAAFAAVATAMEIASRAPEVIKWFKS